MTRWCTLVHPGENDVRKIVYSQPRAILPSSDLLFFIRKMRCEGTRYGVKFSKAPLRGGRRYAPCTPAQDRAACGEKMGSNPILGRFWIFWPSEKGAHVSTHSTLAVVQDSICAVWCLPLAPYTQARKTSDRKQLDSGGWGCRMTRLFSHETGL